MLIAKKKNRKKKHPIKRANHLCSSSEWLVSYAEHSRRLMIAARVSVCERSITAKLSHMTVRFIALSCVYGTKPHTFNRRFIVRDKTDGKMRERTKETGK